MAIGVIRRKFKWCR